MYPTLKELFLESVEEEGWLVERDKIRIGEELKKVAKNLLALGRPAEEVSKATELPLETVEALAQI